MLLCSILYIHAQWGKTWKNSNSKCVFGRFLNFFYPSRFHSGTLHSKKFQKNIDFSLWGKNALYRQNGFFFSAFYSLWTETKKNDIIVLLLSRFFRFGLFLSINTSTTTRILDFLLRLLHIRIHTIYYFPCFVGVHNLALHAAYIEDAEKFNESKQKMHLFQNWK